MGNEFTRRNLFKVTGAGIMMAPLLVKQALAQVPGQEDLEKVLFSGPGLAGGGQLEVRMVEKAEGSDPDVVEIARRMRPYDPESWYVEHKRMAEKNEELAARFETERGRETASEYYLRAVSFWRSALTYLPEKDPRTVPAYNRMKGNFDKAWKLVPPGFEKVEIPWEGKTLEGQFYPARAPQGKKAPVVFNFSGADGILIRGEGGAGQYRARGISYLDMDGPGQGGTLRLKNIYAAPDSERYGKAVLDYLVSRPDVDPNRIGIHGSSMGGYSAPRCVIGDKRFKACAVRSGAYSLQQDLYDYYPPIQERIRWLIGAKDLKDARAKMAEFTLEGRAQQIECPLLVGYSNDDRIMDPRGALKLYEKAVNAKRQMINGTGHSGLKFELRTFVADWFAKELGTA